MQAGTGRYGLGLDGNSVRRLPSSAGTDNYTYDENGQMASRPGENGQQSLGWNAEHQLESVTDGSDTTEFVYDADGSRILRITDDETTFYFDGHELTDDGTAVKAKRYYSLAETAVAVREGASGQISWLLGDHLGSTTVTVDNATGAASHQRYLPYGAPRTTAANPALRDEAGTAGSQSRDGVSLAHGVGAVRARFPTVGCPS